MILAIYLVGVLIASLWILAWLYFWEKTSIRVFDLIGILCLLALWPLAVPSFILNEILKIMDYVVFKARK